MDKSIQWLFISNLELLDKLRQLFPAEKLQRMQFLMAGLAKEEGIIRGNEAAEIM